MPRGAYDIYEDAIMRSSLAGDQPYYVDRSWANHAIDVLVAEGVL